MTYAGGQFQEACLFEIYRKGISAVQFAAKTKEVSFEGGNKPISLETLLNGGNLINYDPADIFKIKAKIVPVETDEVDNIFFGDTSIAAQPLTTQFNLTRYEVRAAVMWHNGTTATTASGATGASDKAYRIYAIDGIITECVPDVSNNRLALDVTIEFAPFSTGAAGNLYRQSSDGTAVLTAIGDYS